MAARLVSAHEGGRRVVGVVSAMGTTTDQLVALATDVSPRPHPREMDMLLSTGERIACALVAMAITDLGQEALSLTGSQAGIITDGTHMKAKIREIRGDRVRDALDEDKIVLVAGFQGFSRDTMDVTTLERAQAGDGTVHVAFTFHRRAIKHLRVPLAALAGGFDRLCAFTSVRPSQP